MMLGKEADVNGYSNDSQIDETDKTTISHKVPDLALGYGTHAWNTGTLLYRPESTGCSRQLFRADFQPASPNGSSALLYDKESQDYVNRPAVCRVRSSSNSPALARNRRSLRSPFTCLIHDGFLG